VSPSLGFPIVGDQRVDGGKDHRLGNAERDPAGIFEPDGRENARTGAFPLVGRTLAASERLAVSGGDENGFAALAGRVAGRDVVRILISNYAIPDEYRVARERDVFEFQVPIGTLRADMSLNVPSRRVDAASAGYTGYTLDIVDLPWGDGPHTVVRCRADADHHGEVLDTQQVAGASITIRGDLGLSSVELIEISLGL